MKSNVYQLYCECDRQAQDGTSRMWKCRSHGKMGNVILHTMYEQYKNEVDMSWNEFWDFSEEFLYLRRTAHTMNSVCVYDEDQFFEDLETHCKVYSVLRKKVWKRSPPPVRVKPKLHVALWRIIKHRCEDDDNHQLSPKQRTWYAVKTIICILLTRRKDLSKEKDTIEVVSNIDYAELHGTTLPDYWLAILVSKTSWHYYYSPRSYED